MATMVEGQASLARLRYLRVSPQKAGLVVDQVRGKKVQDALNILRFSPKAVAKDVYKLWWSAIANAKEREGLKDERGLFIARAFVDPGPSLKRIRANSMGRAFRVLHRTSHITIVLGQKAETPAKPKTAKAESVTGGKKVTK